MSYNVHIYDAGGVGPPHVYGGTLYSITIYYFNDECTVTNILSSSMDRAHVYACEYLCDNEMGGYEGLLKAKWEGTQQVTRINRTTP